MRGGLLPIVYLIIGAFVAADQHYFDHLGGLGRVATAILAMLAWPLVLAGLRIHVSIG